MRAAILALALAAAGCGSEAPTQAAPQGERVETAIFAGGCFWCTEADFEKLPGVRDAVSGYIGGRVADPTYEQVSRGGTGHYEAVRVRYDPARVSYAKLVDHYFRSVDPLDGGGQFCDRGESYRTAIFAASEAQRRLAEREKAEVAKLLGKPIVTPILPTTTFYPAETYHQDYYKKNKLKYWFYRTRCGRDARLKEVWGGKR